MNSVLIFWWTVFLPIWIDKIGKNQDKSINETSVSSISTGWSIQSIAMKSLSDFSRLIDWQIDTDFYRETTPGYSEQSTVSLKGILLLDRLPTMWIPTPCRYRRHFLLEIRLYPPKYRCFIIFVSYIQLVSSLPFRCPESVYTHPVWGRWSFNLNSGQNPLVSLITAFFKKDRVTIARKEWLNHFKCTHVLSIHMVIKLKATPICCSGV